MPTRLRAKMTFANTVSVLALFVALGGTSYAALSKNSVGAKQIKTNGVKSAEIATGAVAADELLDGSIGLADLAANSVNGSKVVDGSLNGADLANGAVGASDLGPDSVDAANVIDESLGTGDVANGSLTGGDVSNGSILSEDVAAGTFLSGAVTVQFTQAAADLGPPPAELSLDAQCLPGQTAIGGGVRGDLTNSEFTKVTASRPVSAPDNSGAPGDGGTFTGWRGTFVHTDPGAGIRPEVWVLCTGAPLAP